MCVFRFNTGRCNTYDIFYYDLKVFLGADVLSMTHLCIGADVLSAETVEFLFSPDSRSAIDTETTSIHLASNSSNYWITGLR